MDVKFYDYCLYADICLVDYLCKSFTNVSIIYGTCLQEDGPRPGQGGPPRAGGPGGPGGAPAGAVPGAGAPAPRV